MNGSSEIAQAGPLVLARLLVAGEKGATGSELSKALVPLIGHRAAGAALAEQLARALASLESHGLIRRTRKGKTERSTLTPAGQRRALEFLGLEHLPPKTKWAQITKTYLAARALDLPAPKDKTIKLIGSDPGFKAALLKTQFDLPLDDYPSFDQALDTLVWKLLGFEPEPGTKFNVKAVKAAVIRRVLEGAGKVDPKADPKKEVTKLLARNVGARQASKDELRYAAIRQWIDRAVEPAIPEAARPVGTPAPAPAPAPVEALDLDTFARRVLEAARSSPSGWFGDHKVFVVHVWRVLRNDPVFAAMGFDDFKRRLGEANHARRLDLSRADMVEAMDPEDVALSKISYLGAEFHFVRL
jgi:hypothetical protein